MGAGPEWSPAEVSIDRAGGDLSLRGGGNQQRGGKRGIAASENSRPAGRQCHRVDAQGAGGCNLKAIGGGYER